jgi:hypothetical protein
MQLPYLQHNQHSTFEPQHEYVALLSLHQAPSTPVTVLDPVAGYSPSKSPFHRKDKSAKVDLRLGRRRNWLNIFVFQYHDFKVSLP